MKSKKLKKKNQENPNVFDQLSEQWWDENGAFKALHSFNILRLKYIKSSMPNNSLKNLKMLDIGCGGGILCEPLARLGAKVTGIDTNKKAIDVAKKHAKKSGLKINYKNLDLTKIQGQKFNLITCMEVLEHMEYPAEIITKSNELLEKNGLFLGSTINKTISSYIFAIVGAEKIAKLIPKGTHEWKRLIKPNYLKKLFFLNNFHNFNKYGVLYNPITNTWSYSIFSNINYFFSASKS